MTTQKVYIINNKPRLFSICFKLKGTRTSLCSEGAKHMSQECNQVRARFITAKTEIGQIKTKQERKTFIRSKPVTTSGMIFRQ